MTESPEIFKICKKNASDMPPPVKKAKLRPLQRLHDRLDSLQERASDCINYFLWRRYYRFKAEPFYISDTDKLYYEIIRMITCQYMLEHRNRATIASVLRHFARNLDNLGKS